MREPTRRYQAVQFALAALCLTPLLLAFSGQGSWQEAWGTLPGEDPVAGERRRTELFSAFGHSGWVGLGTAAVALAIGLPAGWALSRRRRGPWVWAVCAAPLALAPSVAVSGWLHWLAPAGAPLQSAFAQGQPASPSFLFSPFGVALVLGLNLWPIVAFETYPAFLRARRESYAAALLCGSPARAFVRVVLPLARAELAAATLVVFLLAATDFTASSLLLVRTLPIEVYDLLWRQRPVTAAWATLPLLLLVALLVWALVSVRTAGWSRESSDEGDPVRSGGRWGRAMMLVVGLGVFLGFVFPLWGCVGGAFPGDAGLSWWHRATLGWPRMIEGVRSGADALGVSLRLAAAVALLTWCAGALRTVLWPEMPAGPLRWATLLLLLLPGAFLADGLMRLDLSCAGLCDNLGRLGAWFKEARPGGALLAAGCLLRYLYLPVRLAEEGLRATDPALLESAQLSGHGRWSRGLTVALPLVRLHLLAASALAFLLTFGELAVSDKLAPPGAVPLSVWLLHKQHYEYDEAVFGMSLVAGLVAAGVLAGAALLSNWFVRRSR